MHEDRDAKPAKPAKPPWAPKGSKTCETGNPPNSQYPCFSGALPLGGVGGLQLLYTYIFLSGRYQAAKLLPVESGQSKLLSCWKHTGLKLSLSWWQLMELAPKLQYGSRWLHHGEDAWEKNGKTGELGHFMLVCSLLLFLCLGLMYYRCCWCFMCCMFWGFFVPNFSGTFCVWMRGIIV